LDGLGTRMSAHEYEYEYYRSRSGRGGDDTVYRVDVSKATQMIAENGGLPYDTGRYCQRIGMRIDAFSPLGWILTPLKDYSDLDGFVDSYTSFGKLFELYGGHESWDVKGTVTKESSSRIAVDLALRQLVDASIAVVVVGDEDKVHVPQRRVYVREPPTRRP